MDADTRRDLNSLPKSLAELVGKHIVAAGLLMDEDPERAYVHASYARRKASRLPSVREASGVAAYTVGKWQEALSDLRAARRMSGRDNFLAVMADCERGLGRPERALEITGDPAAEALDAEERIELRIVASGARRDMGDPKGALAELQVPELKERRARPWIARLFYAYADVLEELGREEDAREYFSRAAAVDTDGVTDADERLATLEGVELVDVDLEDGIVWTDAEEQDFEEPEEAPSAPTVERGRDHDHRHVRDDVQGDDDGDVVDTEDEEAFEASDEPGPDDAPVTEPERESGTVSGTEDGAAETEASGESDGRPDDRDVRERD
ncbi:tetratricopeptide repeat protein [Nocardiopsis lambiniae]|uniref:Tetratricopeptide repeat protein n=1 Tax=Nocardiopsis lambiniae TaxID=3075539 RepID=A0ABU2MCA0_9ACTN|nr:tetratricopeptide repeat protein [Nocardiopsis sp. DSM 44743]MDT0330315.1 tetratricopeptide repeat protein [Nocardiopsis sp. DSM 44743]